MTDHLQTFAQERIGKPSKIKGRKFPIELLTESEVGQIIKKCSPRCPTGTRNRAIIALMYRGCLRVAEVVNLYPRDVDLQSGMLTVRHGKNNKRRVVGLDSQTLTLLHKWIGAKQKLGYGSQQPLFTTLQGKPVQKVYLRNLVKRLARKCGIDKRTHPHLFRHCGAVSMIKDGMNIIEVSAALGHSSIATTSNYLQHVCPTELVSKMNARSWNF